MRGKPIADSKVFRIKGITPAHAGKTSFISNYTYMVEDHPRACGENDAGTATLRKARGSPPRMRGKQEQLLRIDDEDRITPAHAGKTLRQENIPM